MANYVIYVPLVPSNYDYFDTVNDEHFYVKEIVDGSQEFTLYKNSAEMHRVDKSAYLELVGTISGVFRDETSITNMSITIEYDRVIDFNYVYIHSFNRYYYVTDVTLINYNLYEISLSVDVLMSYKDAIKNCKGFIDRNEFTFNPNIVDSKRVIEQGVDIEQAVLLNEVFTNDTCYVLTGFAINSDI